MNSVGDRHDLIGCAMFEATLNEKVAKSVDHEWIRLVDNGFNNLKLLLSCADLQFLLKEYGSLLIIATNNLVHDVFPVAGHRLVKKTTIVHWFEWCDVGLTGGSTHLWLSGTLHH